MPGEQGGENILAQAQKIGEGLLQSSDNNSNSDDYYVDEQGQKHKLNRYEDLMRTFSSMGVN